MRGDMCQPALRIVLVIRACTAVTHFRRFRDAPIAQVTGGRVRGITKDNVTAFYGVPYAKAKRYAAAAPASSSASSPRVYIK